MTPSKNKINKYILMDLFIGVKVWLEARTVFQAEKIDGGWDTFQVLYIQIKYTFMF